MSRARVRRTVVPFVSLLVAIVVLPALPAHAAQGAAPSPIASVDPASAGFQVPGNPPALTDAQHQPVVDLSGLEGVWPSDVVQTLPIDTSNAISPQDAVD